MNGEAVVVRPIQSADAPALVGLRAVVSPDTLHRHVLVDQPTLSLAAATRFSEVDYDARMAFVAVVSDELVGLGSYERAEGRHQLGGWFCGHRYLSAPRGRDLAVREPDGVARTRGMLRFIAEVWAQNAEMLEMFAATGLRCSRYDGTATVRVEIDLRPTAAYRASCDQREATAEVASIAAILQPRSVAVVGAGRHPGNVGHEVLRSLLIGDSRELSTRSILRRARLRRARVSGAVVGTRANRPGSRRRSCSSCPWRDRRRRLGWRARRHHHHRWLRGDRPLGRRVEAELLSVARARHANRWPELPRCREHRPRDPDERHVCLARPAARAPGPHLAVRRGRRRAR